MSRQLRFQRLFSLCMVAALLLQLFVPLLKRGPGFLQAVSAEEDTAPEWEASDDTTLFDGSESGYAQLINLPSRAESLEELIPDFLPTLQTLDVSQQVDALDGTVQSVQVGQAGGVATLHNGTVLVLVDEGVIGEDVIISVSALVEQVADDADGIVPTDLVPMESIEFNPSAVAEMVPEPLNPIIADVNAALPLGNPADQHEDPSSGETPADQFEPQPTEEPPTAEAMPLNEADFTQTITEVVTAEQSQLPPFEVFETVAPPYLQLAPAPPMDQLPAPPFPTDGMIDDIETTEPPANEPVVLNMDDLGDPATWSFQLQLRDALTGEPVITPDSGLYLAFDVRDRYVGSAEIWSLGLFPADDPTHSIAPDVNIHDYMGLISTPLTLDSASDLWEAQISGIQRKSAGVNSSSSGSAPSPWKYEANIPQASPFSGAAAYNYPIELPPGRAGLTPNIDVSYTSRSVDGLLANKGMDQGELGIGWSFNTIEINRTQSDVGHQGCHCARHYDRFSLALGGASFTLLYDRQINSNLLEYKALNAPQLRVRKHRNGNAPTDDGIYWTVTDADGTVYRLGYTNDAEVGHRSKNANNIQHISENGSAPTWVQSPKYSTTRWRVDTITDIAGNQIQYEYYEWASEVVQGVETWLNRLTAIRYNYSTTAPNQYTRIPAGSPHATDIFFHNNWHNWKGWPQDADGVNYFLVDEVRVEHLGQPFGRTKFNHTIHGRNNKVDDQCTTNPQDERMYSIAVVITGIEQEDWMGHLLPPTTFDYQAFKNVTGEYELCFLYERLTGVRTPYGGYTRILYQGDERSSVNREGYFHEAYTFYYIDTGLTAHSSYGQTWYVTRIENYDGVRGWFKDDLRGGEYTVTGYSYANPCYDDDDGVADSRFGAQATQCLMRRPTPDNPNNTENPYGSGKLQGFNESNTYQYDYASDNHPLLRRSNRRFYRDGFQANAGQEGYQHLLRFGKPYQENLYNSDGVLLERKEMYYATVSNNAKHYFTPLLAECQRTYNQYRVNTTAMNSYRHCVSYRYDENMQGDQQLGNVTTIQQYGSIGGSARWQTTVRKYFPNTGDNWVVNRVAWEAVNDWGNLSAFTVNYYDNRHHDYDDFKLPPTQGRLTRVVQFENSAAVSDGNADGGISTFFAYDPVGNIASVADDGGNTTTTDYDPTYRLYPTTVCNPNDQCEYFDYFYLPQDNGNYSNDGKAGLLHRHQQVNELWQYYFYDSRGRLKQTFQGWREQGHPNNQTDGYIRVRPNVVYHYEDATIGGADGRLTKLPWSATWTKTQDYAIQWSNGGAWSREIYNGFGQVVQRQTPHTDWAVEGSGARGQRIISDVTYDGAGQTVAQSKPYFAPAIASSSDRNLYVTPDRSQPHSTTRYDAAGRAVWSQDLNGETSAAIHGNRSRYSRDGRGFLSAAFFDAVGQLTAVDESVATFSDDFRPDDYSRSNTGFGYSWGVQGNVQETEHVARLTGDGSWNNYLYNDLPTGGDQGVQFSFRASSEARGAFYIKRGTWPDPAGDPEAYDYQRWGIYLDGTQLLTDQYEDEVHLPAQVLMTLTAGKRYNVLLRGAQSSDAAFSLLVWEDGNPQKRAELQQWKNSRWHQAGWRFYAQLNSGQVDLDNYNELTVNRTRYRYDVLGNLTAVTNAQGHQTTMEYDWLERKTRMVDPDMGTWTYQYDKRGNLISQTDAKNQTIAFVYDNLNRLTEKRVGSATGAYLARFEYDGGQSDSNRSRGQRTAAYAYAPPAAGEEMYHNRVAYSYDELGRVEREIRHFRADGLSVYNFDFVYSQGNLPVAMRYPDGEEVQTGYDWQTGLATSLRQYDASNPGQNKFVDYISNGTTYNEAGQITQLIYGNGRTANYTYDDGYRLSAMTTLSDDLPDFSYDYDGNSNIWRIYEQMNGLNQYQQFTYDSLNRLRVAYTRNGNNEYDFDQAGAYYQSTAYDALGNITGKADYKDRNYTYNRYGYGQANGILTGEMQHIHAVTHLNNTEMFEYDANGNMTTRNADGKTWTQTWTVENMLKRANDGTDDVQFFYDADGQMVLRQESGQRKTVNLGDGLYQRTYVGNDPAGALEDHKRYMFNGQAVAERQNNSVFFTLNDHLGGAVSNFGASWGTRQTRRDAWGQERYRNGTIISNYAFTGQRWDERLGLYDYNARYYDPVLGRFLSADTIIPDGTNPQHFSRYTYVSNSPPNYIDPDGHIEQEVARQVLERNSTVIHAEARKRDGVNPVLLGMVIVNELGTGIQSLEGGNEAFLNYLKLLALVRPEKAEARLLTASFGITSIQIRNARMLEDLGYIDRFDGDNWELAEALNANEGLSIQYTAAMLQYLGDQIDAWATANGVTLTPSQRDSLIMQAYNSGWNDDSNDYDLLDNIEAGIEDGHAAQDVVNQIAEDGTNMNGEATSAAGYLKDALGWKDFVIEVLYAPFDDRNMI